MSGWRVDYLPTVGSVVPDTFWLSTEDEAVRLAKVLDPSGKRVVAWWDAESAEPWMAPQACEVAPGIDFSVKVDPNATGVIQGPQIGAERLGVIA